MLRNLTRLNGRLQREAINEAINKLIDFRTQEGAALQKKFTEKIDNISALLKSIEPFEKSRVPKIKDKIIDGLKQIPEVDYDKNRLEQELIYYIEKLDISEEKQRLSNHLKYFRETMNESGHGVARNWGSSHKKWDVKSILLAQKVIRLRCRTSLSR